MASVFSEITALSEKDCFHIVERHKSLFDYPLHKHSEFELNFVENAAGVRRIVGDSVEEIGNYDLVLVGAENLEHCWEQGACRSKDIREITVQFSHDLFEGGMMEKNQFKSIRGMLDKARNGLCFPMDAILKVYSQLDVLASQKDSFLQMLSFFQILYVLSNSESRQLASSAFAHVPVDRESMRAQRIKDYISEHYADDLSLDDLASRFGMSSTSLSRYFKAATGKTIMGYIIEMRLGVASRALVDTDSNISDICYSCGFNNLSNFNRIFKSKRNMSPREFRQIYKKKKVIV